MSTGWNSTHGGLSLIFIINLLGNEYWLELDCLNVLLNGDYKPTGK